MTKLFPFLAAIFLVASMMAPIAHAQTREVSLPTTQIYFQCGNTTNPSHDYDAIDWEGPIKNHYLSVLDDATSITYGESIKMQWRRCLDLHSRQFQLTIEAIAEYIDNDSIPTAAEITHSLSEHSNQLRAVLSAACFDEQLFAYEYRDKDDGHPDQLGGTSWSTRLCYAERLGGSGPTNDDVDHDAETEWKIEPLYYFIAVVIGVLLLLCGGCWLCAFFGCAVCSACGE